MGNELFDSLLDTYRHAPALEAAEQALEDLEQGTDNRDLPIGDLYDESSRGEETRFAIAWFPRSEHGAVAAEWPDLADDLADADRYCRRIEQELRDLAAASGQRPSIAPLTLKKLTIYSRSEGLVPTDGGTRARLAAELDRRGETILWPPGRNEPCWCGSGRKYKRCCGH